MKNFLIFLTVSIAFNSHNLQAQNTSPEDCLKNISLYSDYMKQGNINGAIPFWRNAFCCCPDEVRQKYKSSNLNLYVNGVRIMKYLADNAEGELKEKYIDSLLLMYDERMTLMPSQRKNVLWRKANDLASYRPNQNQQIYDIAKEAIDLQDIKVESSTLALCQQQAALLYTESKLNAEEMLSMYNKLTQITDEQAKAGKDVKQIKETLDEIFLRSGAASCENLIALYSPRFNDSKDDVDFLEKLVNVLSANQCNTAKLYFEANEALFKAKPCPEVAISLATTFKQQGEYIKAQEYYNLAIEIDPNNDNKSKYCIDLGNMLNRDLSNPKEARIYAKKALEFVPNNGYAYFLLGEIYSNEKNCGGNDFEKRSVYWAVVDCYEKAKQVDASLSENANKYIAAFKQYFPSKEDIFFYNLERGKSYTINCWIDEKTTIRPRE
ncbi:MAG: hypothetical protein ACRCSB_05225 [Bacteroidales bacterium]